jgi:hypothetical protein
VRWMGLDAPGQITGFYDLAEIPLDWE